MESFNRDPHREMAAAWYDIPEEEVDAEQRRIGKVLNYAGLYGASPTSFKDILRRYNDHSTDVPLSFPFTELERRALTIEG